MNNQHSDTFIFKEKRAVIKVNCADIVFFESDGHYVNIHMNTGEVFTTRCTLERLAEMLDREVFIKVRRGIVVNLCYVHSINPSEVLLEYEWQSLPVGRSCRATLEAAMDKFNKK